MSPSESSAADKAFFDAIAYVRRVLVPRIERESAWPTLAAAAFFAVCAIGFAVAAILAPPVTLTIPSVARTSIEPSAFGAAMRDREGYAPAGELH